MGYGSSFRGRGRGGRGKRGRDDRPDASGGGAFDGSDDASTSGLIRQREAYMRMNFLFQAAQLTATGPTACLSLSRFYAATMRKIGTRLVIRSSPHLKAEMCKRCCSMLTPTPSAQHTPHTHSATGEGALAAVDVTQTGSTVALRMSAPSAEPALIRTCRCCGAQRRVGLKRQMRQRAAAAKAEAAAQQQPVTAAAQQHHLPAAAAVGVVPDDADAMR